MTPTPPQPPTSLEPPAEATTGPPATPQVSDTTRHRHAPDAPQNEREGDTAPGTARPLRPARPATARSAPRTASTRPASPPGAVPARTGPPVRRDSRRPGTRRTPVSARPSASALRAAALREREGQPPYWFARRLLLVLSGQHPVHTLIRHARSSAYEQLSVLATVAPLRPQGSDRTTPAVLEARGTRPRDGVIEAFARVSTGGRQRAIAFRLEYSAQRRWLCAAVELDGLSGATRR